MKTLRSLVSIIVASLGIAGCALSQQRETESVVEAAEEQEESARLSGSIRIAAANQYNLRGFSYSQGAVVQEVVRLSHTGLEGLAVTHFGNLELGKPIQSQTAPKRADAVTEHDWGISYGASVRDQIRLEGGATYIDLDNLHLRDTWEGFGTLTFDGISIAGQTFVLSSAFYRDLGLNRGNITEGRLALQLFDGRLMPFAGATHNHHYIRRGSGWSHLSFGFDARAPLRQGLDLVGTILATHPVSDAAERSGVVEERIATIGLEYSF